MNPRSIRLLAALGAVAVAAGALFARMQSGSLTLVSGTLLPQPRTLNAFELHDTTGQRFGAQELRGHPTLLYFGFTHCPDVCPTTLSTVAQLERLAPVPGMRVVFVSIDPGRDDAATLRAYLDAFSGDFIGARGTPPELAPLLHGLNAIAVREDLPGGGYTMDHSATLYLLDRQGRLLVVFSPPFTAAALAGDLRRLAAARRL